MSDFNTEIFIIRAVWDWTMLIVKEGSWWSLRKLNFWWSTRFISAYVWPKLKKLMHWNRMVHTWVLQRNQVPLFLCFFMIYLMVLAKRRDNIRKLFKNCLRCDLSVYLFGACTIHVPSWPFPSHLHLKH